MRPKLMLSFDATDEMCRQVVSWSTNPPQSFDELVLGLVLRVRVENIGRTPAKDCRVFAKVSRGAEILVEPGMSSALSWMDDDTFACPVLLRGLPAYVNVVNRLEGRPDITFLTKSAKRGAHDFSAGGQYVVDLRAEGENFVSPGAITMHLAHDPMANYLDMRAEVVSQRAARRVGWTV